MTRDRKSSGWRGKLLLVIGSLLLCFLVLEIGLRVQAKMGNAHVDATTGKAWETDGDGPLHVRSDNPRRIYELRPGADLFAGPVQQQITTNADGYRDHEFQVVKPPGTYRVIVIGDSVTFGWAEPLDQTYPARLERSLRASGIDGAEVYNMGIGGYNALQELEVIKEDALRFDPDLLVIGYVLNDDMIGGADGHLSAHFTRSWSHAYTYLKVRAERVLRRIGRSATEEAFAELESLAKRHGVPVLVVVFPRLKLEEDGTYAYQDQHDGVAALCRQHGFLHLDLLEAYKALGLNDVGTDELHPEAEGMQVAADQIRNAMLEHAAAIGLPSRVPDGAQPSSPVQPPKED